jgi:hypothetical protein
MACLGYGIWIPDENKPFRASDAKFLEKFKVWRLWHGLWLLLTIFTRLAGG